MGIFWKRLHHPSCLHTDQSSHHFERRFHDNQSPERISRRKVNAAYERASEQQVPNSASDGPPRVDLSIVPSYDAVPLLFGVLLVVA